MNRAQTPHTDWCGRDHRCNLAEHRSGEFIVDLPGYGRAVLVRVKAEDGREHAEIRARIALHDYEAGARWQLQTLLHGLRNLIDRAAIRPRRAGLLAVHTAAISGQRAVTDRRAS